MDKKYVNNKIIIIGLFFIVITMFILNCNYSIELFSNNVDLRPDNITVVSGYWNIKNKYGANKYDEWFKNTLNINQRYVFFCDTSNV